MRRLCFSIAMLLFPILVWAQTIVERRVDGNERLSDEAVLQYVSSKKGAVLDRIRVRDDLRALYNTGLFNDVRIDMEEASGGLRLVVVVSEKEYIQKFLYEGNSKVSTEDIEKALELKPPVLWDEALVKRTIEKIRKLYRDKGYYLVTVRTEILKEDRIKNLKFLIDEGTKVLVRKIYIQGNSRLSDETLKGAMLIREGGYWSGLTSREIGRAHV